MVETCLWVLTWRNVFGIPLRKLMELGKKEVEDWESIPSLPHDFHSKLPEMMMRPFAFDSKLFLAGGLARSGTSGTHDAPSSKIYQFFFDADNKLRISEADSIPPPPTLVFGTFIANIGGEVYLLAYDRIMIPRDVGLWVLRSGQWQPLPDPPPLDDIGCIDWCDCFVHQDKLFLQVDNIDKLQLLLYVFDPRTLTWTKLEDSITKSFVNRDIRAFCYPSITVSLPDVRNCSVTLTWSLERSPDDFQVKVKIHAMLLNNKDYSVFRYQSLDECSEAIQPTSFNFGDTKVNFLDLGSGMVCAVVTGYAPEHDNGLSPVICVLVFTLSLAGEPGTEDQGEKQRFLSVDDVLVNRVFTMKDYYEDCMEELPQNAFIFPPKRELQLPLKHAYSKGGSGLKLAMEAESDEMAKGQWLVTRVVRGLRFSDR